MFRHLIGETGMLSMKKKQAAERPAVRKVNKLSARVVDINGYRVVRDTGDAKLVDKTRTNSELKCTSFKLAVEEACFLRWLRDNHGYGKRTGMNWMRNDARLVKLGYVTAWNEENAVHYTLSPSGARALTKCDLANRANPVLISPWPKSE
jgi:hypothetical protein